MAKHSVLFTCSLAAAMMAAIPSYTMAQEEGSTPGAIPDPSTYKGSTELQQQSDQQDQQSRNQQQQQGTNPQGQTYGQFDQTSRPVAASTTCFIEVGHLRELAPLANKVDLANFSPDSHAPFDLNLKPAPSEKVLLHKWMLARHYCGTVWNSESHSPQQITLNEKFGWQATEMLIQALTAGRMTFGDFNYQRMMNYQAFQRNR